MLICPILVCIAEQHNRSKTAPTQTKTNLARNDIGPESVIIDASLEQGNAQNESIERPTATYDWVVMETTVQQETIDNIAVAQGEILANHDSDDIPTFEEALEMEVVTVGSPQNEIRRRVSSQLSLKSDELPDYENYESHPVISGIEK